MSSPEERFELLERVGRGGMGTVWKARDRETGDVVALKILHEQYADDPYFVQRFEREVEVTRRIDSPYVVKTLGFGRREDRPFIVMEYVEGTSLRDVIRERGQLPWRDAKELLRHVAEGLAAAHAAGVVHRDIKPSNIIVTPDGTPKLVDFGIARAADLTALTGTSTMMGTPTYMAPEGTPSPAADIYGLGCVAYEMLTGAPPFTGDSQHEVVVRHIRDAPDLGRVSVEARSVVGWMLRKVPADRPPAAKLLDAFEGRRSIPALPVAPNTVAPKPVRKRVTILAAVGALVVFGGGAIAELLLASSSSGGSDGPANAAALAGTTPSPTPSATATGVPAGATATPTATSNESPTTTAVPRAPDTPNPTPTSSPTSRSTATPTFTPAINRVRTSYQLACDAFWSDSGVVVQAGDRVSINGSGSCFYGPGLRATPECQPGVATERPENGAPAPGLRGFCLVGRVGTGNAFEINSGLAFTANAAGRLMFALSDGYRGDNSGSLTVIIAVN